MLFADIAGFTPWASKQVSCFIKPLQVEQAQAFWQRLGFITKNYPQLEAKLVTYGQYAVYMTQTIT